MTAALTKDACSDNRKATTYATSSRRPKRFIGFTLTKAFPTSSGFSGSSCLKEASTIGVIIAPGATALIVIPY